MSESDSDEKRSSSNAEKPEKKKKKKNKHNELTEKSHIDPLHKNKLREIINKIEDQAISIEFRDPLAWKRIFIYYFIDL